MEYADLHKIVIAALLHDIGKFSYRGGTPLSDIFAEIDRDQTGWTGSHAKWSADFVHRVLKDDLIEDLVLHHHHPAGAEHKHYAEIIQEADHISSAMDREPREGEGDVRTEPLKSIFPCIAQPQGTGNTKERYYLPSILSLDENPFPLTMEDVTRYQTTLTRSYDILWKNFMREAEILIKNPHPDTVTALLKRFTARIPSAVYKNEPDIPLYDHAVTTAAIAHCLTVSENENPFLLIQGDLSGIQHFLFDVDTPQDARKGMAKRLRGRSFWLQLFMDAVVNEIEETAGLFAPSVLWNTGGKFLILAPNTPTICRQVEAIGRTVNQHLLDRLGGRICLVLAMVETDKEGLKDFQATSIRLTDETGRRKVRKFADCIVTFTATGENRPLDAYCSVCGGVLDDSGICQSCKDHASIGTRLARARYCVRSTRNRHPISFQEFGLRTSYRLTEEALPEPGDDIFSINDTRCQVPGGGARGSMFIGNTVPVVNNDILTFGNIADLSHGAPRLGIIKADVDNLGRIFAFGLPKEKRSISRIHTLSDQFQFFFAGYLNRICQEFVVFHDLCENCRAKVPASERTLITDKDENGASGKQYVLYDTEDVCERCRDKAVSKFYISYSGGDDLLIIGPWDAALDLANRIYEDFRRFTAENPEITLSAGLAVVSPRLPVSRAVALADDLLESAKINGRDRIAFFDFECVGWRDGRNGYERGFSTLLKSGKDLEEGIKKGVISKRTIYTLLRLWTQTYDDPSTVSFEETTAQRIRRKRYLPHLKYMVVRNVEKKNRETIEQMIIPVFPWIKLPVYWASLRMRTDKR